MFLKPPAMRFKQPGFKAAVQLLTPRSALLSLISSLRSVSSDINHFGQEHSLSTFHACLQ